VIIGYNPSPDWQGNIRELVGGQPYQGTAAICGTPEVTTGLMGPS